MSNTHLYTVRGMTCTGCATKVGKAVEGVAGVTAADVDLGTGTVRVTGAAFEDGAVRAAISDAGYQVD